MLKLAKKDDSLIYNGGKITLEQIKVNELLFQERNEVAKKYREKYPFAGVYYSILCKLGIIDNQGRAIPLLNSQNTEPISFCFTLKEANYRFLYNYENSKSIFYNLIINPWGEIIFETYQDKRRIFFETFDTENSRLFLDLPYLLGRVIQDKNLENIKKNMEIFAKENSFSTFSNIFNFAKKNLDIVNNIPNYFSNLENDVRDKQNSEQDISDRFYTINDYFIVNIKNYGRKNRYIKYFIKENEKKEPYLLLDVGNICFIGMEWLENFPVKIDINKDSFIPFYLPEKFFKDRSNYYENVQDDIIKNTSTLVSFEQKVINLSTSRIKLDVLDKTPSAAGLDCSKSELDNNLKTVVRYLKKYFKVAGAVEANIRNQDKLDLFKSTVFKVEKSAEPVRELLAKLYKKEVVLNNI